MRTVETHSVPSTLAGVRQAMDAFEDFGRRHGLASESTWRFLVALDELVSNIVRHGAPAPETVIDLTFSIEAQQIEVEIIDDAAPFNPLLARGPDTTSALDVRRPGGQGIALIRRLMDDTRYERCDNRNHFVITARA